MELLIVVVVIVALAGAFVIAGRRADERRELERIQELEPVRKLAEEDVTALGEQLQELHIDVLLEDLDAGTRADYQKALDEYETAKVEVAQMSQPDDIKQVTEVVEDGRYRIACVLARVAGEELPVRRPPCFFDPRHGPSVADVLWAPPGGTERDVPACELDRERVLAGAEPDIRKVNGANGRVPYFEGGPAYQPYAAGYFGAFTPMDWLFMGAIFGGFDGLGAIGEGVGDALGGIGDGIGSMFDGFDGFDF